MARTARTVRVSRYSAGFNLLELLIVITIASILMGIGVPSYRYITNANRVSTEVNGLLGDMQLARSEAIKEAQNVSVCPANPAGTMCVDTSDWSNGWIVFTDFLDNGIIDAGPPNNDMVLHVQKPLSIGDSLKVDNVNVKFVSFNREGFAAGLPNGNDLTLTLHATPNSAQWTRCLDVTLVGMMKTERSGDTAADGVVHCL